MWTWIAEWKVSQVTDCDLCNVGCFQWSLRFFLGWCLMLLAPLPPQLSLPLPLSLSQNRYHSLALKARKEKGNWKFFGKTEKNRPRPSSFPPGVSILLSFALSFRIFFLRIMRSLILMRYLLKWRSRFIQVNVMAIIPTIHMFWLISLLPPAAKIRPRM